ncbi:helix-turn-helix domain-containing protein [Microlunatus endophyticus]|uniref:helix-turn-helix domain-containing protein n=1 Tax=Microlunatus endophyticus TaxID=1716077 RepID=UPI0016688C21|nr:helix-turn-helix domain-containing protein [Microlunatus endophyticus]
MAAKHHVSRALVRRALTEEDVERRPADQLDPEHDVAIIQLRDNLGLAWTEISAISGIPTSTLQRRYAKATQTPTLPSRPRKDELTTLATGYEAGKTVSELAAECDVHPRTIRRQLRRQGVESTRLRPRQQLPVSDDELHDRHEAGETYRELAAEYGVSATLIWRRVNFRDPLITDA